MQQTIRGYIGLGSNLGDRLAHLQNAVDQLNASEGLSVSRVSSVWEAPPWGYDSPNTYYNAVVEVHWLGPPLKLFEQCYRIEAAEGRHQHGKKVTHEYHDRVVDLDLLWLDGIGSQDERLRLPHPLAHLRAFVLLPWVELSPRLVLDGRAIEDWLNLLDPGEASQVKRVPGMQLVISVRE